MKIKLVVFFVLAVLSGLNSCERPDTSTAVNWNPIVTAANFTLSVADGLLDISMTQASHGKIVSITQSGLTGDFTCAITVSSFTSLSDKNVMFMMAISSCIVGMVRMSSTTATSVLAGMSYESYDFKETDNPAGTFTITRTGADVVCSYSAGGVSGSVSGTLDSGVYDVELRMENTGSTMSGTTRALIDSFTVIDGGGLVRSDDFTTDKIN